MSKSLFWKITDQILHFLMGFGVAFPFSFVNPFLGVIVSRLVWMGREYYQHKRIIWWNLDLLFIDLGIITAIIVYLILKGV